jgi:hypothetical protein
MMKLEDMPDCFDHPPASIKPGYSFVGRLKWKEEDS